MTTVPPTYINACRRSPSRGEDFSKASIKAVHSSCSSARSSNATMLWWPRCQLPYTIKMYICTYLSLKFTWAALLPSTYKVLALPGRARTTPSKEAPRSGASIVTLLAYGRAPSAFRGKRVLKKSSASLLCLALIAEMLPLPASSTSSGVRGGVTRSDDEAEARLPMMSRGAEAKGKLWSSPVGESGGGVGG